MPLQQSDAIIGDVDKPFLVEGSHCTFERLLAYAKHVIDILRVRLVGEGNKVIGLVGEVS